jgi:hypothetical protein
VLGLFLGSKGTGLVVRYWPTSSALRARVCVWARAKVWAYASVMRSRLRPDRDDGNVVEQADFRQLSNEILVFRLESGMSRMRKSKGNTAHDATNEEQNVEVVGLAQMFHAPVDVLWAEGGKSTPAALTTWRYAGKLVWIIAIAFDNRTALTCRSTTTHSNEEEVSLSNWRFCGVDPREGQ